MTGAKLIDLWEAATRAVMGVLVFHPGVTQVCDEVIVLASTDREHARPSCDGDCGRCTTDKR
jgi:hypothetical protein